MAARDINGDRCSQSALEGERKGVSGCVDWARGYSGYSDGVLRRSDLSFPESAWVVMAGGQAG